MKRVMVRLEDEQVAHLSVIRQIIGVPRAVVIREGVDLAIRERLKEVQTKREKKQ